MDKLHALDQIAYIRFASVYQSFEGIEDSSVSRHALEQKGTKRRVADDPARQPRAIIRTT